MSVHPIKIERYPPSKNKSLRAWSAADEYVLEWVLEHVPTHKRVGIFNDRFGFLSCHLNQYHLSTFIHLKSQEKSIENNLENNYLAKDSIYLSDLFSGDGTLDIAIINIPKSLDLFRYFLYLISKNSANNISITCGFMTRHFSPQILKIAELFFHDVSQSKAKKKSRLLFLKTKKEIPGMDFMQEIHFKDFTYRQLPGVFSSNHIDYATQFFLEHLIVDKNDSKILDLASGNGIIAREIQQKNNSAEIHLLDDSFLAIKSSELNIKGENIKFHFNNNLDPFKDDFFDAIYTNPPFHFGHEINLQIPLQLLKSAYRCLKKGGKLQVVANRHLNYKNHLDHWFESIDILAENPKFIIYLCSK